MSEDIDASKIQATHGSLRIPATQLSTGILLDELIRRTGVFQDCWGIPYAQQYRDRLEEARFWLNKPAAPEPRKAEVVDGAATFGYEMTDPDETLHDLQFRTWQAEFSSLDPTSRSEWLQARRAEESVAMRSADSMARRAAMLDELEKRYS